MANAYPNLTRAAIRIAIGAVIFLIFVGLAGGCMTTSIGSGQGAVKYSMFGGTDLDAQYGEGLQPHAPWVRLITYDLRVQEAEETMSVLASNGLEIGVEVSIRWRPDPEDLPQLHTTYGQDYFEKVIQPELRSVTREVIGQYTPDELYSTRRTEMQDQIFEQVEERVESRYIILDAVLIRGIQLPDQIRAAIERKLQEEQRALEYEYRIQQERLEAERKLIEAEGEAAYQRIIAESLSPQFLRFKGIEATRELAASPNTKTIIVGNSEDGLPVILGGQ